jgi:hypothetical protein
MTTATLLATYELKAIKEFKGDEGYGMNANLYRNGTKVASIIDHGDGGILSYSFDDRSQADGIICELYELGRQIKPIWMHDDFELADWYVNWLQEVAANNKASKKAVMFRKTDEADVNLFANRNVYVIPLDDPNDGGDTREEAMNYLLSHYPDGDVWDPAISNWVRLTYATN